MILDTSVLVAIALVEPESDVFLAKIDVADTVGVGSPTLVEAAIVLAARQGEDPRSALERIVANADATVIDFGDAHWRAAISAWLRFGKGRHPAKLNLGDCLTYAVAKIAGQPVLAKGDEFALTDLAVA